MNWADILSSLLKRQDLSPAEASWAMGQIMTGQAPPTQIAAFAVALRAKGESPAEVAALVETMLAHANPMPRIPDAVDVVGTGGDRANTVNISTMAAIVVAGANIPVVKHGNRASSSTCGSADVLAELGIRIDAEADEVFQSVGDIGIGFCFAPHFHPGYRYAGSVRRELGIPTVFNFLGPLSNPARPRAASVGCADSAMAPIVAQVLAAHEVSALVARGDDGLDELTTTAPTHIWLTDGHDVVQATIDAVEFGLDRANRDDLTGGDATYNARVVRDVLSGAPGAARDAVLLNAAAAVAAYRGVTPANLVEALRDGITAARESIDSGAAHNVLERWIARS